MKIGLFFGTFNPIHIGHLIIANYLTENTDLDQIWMVVTPHNPFKKKETLLNDRIRFEMVFLATEDYPKIKPSDIEFYLPQPNYTTHTLIHLQEKFPKNKFSLIIGKDNLNSLHKWKNYEYIIENHDIYVYPRAENNTTSMFDNFKNIHFVEAPIIEISSTFVRKEIRKEKNVRPLLPSSVWNYIDYNNLYKNKFDIIK